jgi:hypothetical protein
MKAQPLEDLEMHDLLRLIYPEHIRSDDDEYFELSADICDNATVNLGDGFEPKLSDLLGRVVMLTMPMKSGLTQQLSHCLGEVEFSDGAVNMMAAVRRDAKP